MLTEAAVKIALETGRLLLKLQQKSTIQGEIIGKNGLAITNAQVTLCKQDGNSHRWTCDTTLSGSFLFYSIPPGVYRIDVNYGAYYFNNMDRVGLARGKELSLVINLPINGGMDNSTFHKIDESHTTLDIIVNNRSIKTTHKNGNNYIFPSIGEEYSVRVGNNSDAKLLAVVTVDGLSVMNGDLGSFHSGGYIVKPSSKVTIPGWRLNNSEVAKFVFLKKGGSYAQLTNRPTNVGVISCAFFEEDIEEEAPEVVCRLVPEEESGVDCCLGMSDQYDASESCHHTSDSETGFEDQDEHDVMESEFDLGTGFGNKTEHDVIESEFERKEPPCAIKYIYYVGDEKLPETSNFTPNPFPGCKPPPGWSG